MRALMIAALIVASGGVAMAGEAPKGAVKMRVLMTNRDRVTLSVDSGATIEQALEQANHTAIAMNNEVGAVSFVVAKTKRHKQAQDGED
jgi:hypothetical protein